MPRSRSTYHHGDLRAALIAAADDLIAEGGVEAFSLRAAAQRAGVSPGAPAYHFESAKGLLTEVALLAFERAERYIRSAGHFNNVTADVRAVSLAFIRFAHDHPGHFRLMFRNDLVDRDDPRFPEVSGKPGMRLVHAIAAYRGNDAVNFRPFDDSADMLSGMATLLGLAHLVLEEKAAHFFEDATSDTFLENQLPAVLARMFPERAPEAERAHEQAKPTLNDTAKTPLKCKVRR